MEQNKRELQKMQGKKRLHKVEVEGIPEFLDSGRKS